MPKNRIEHPYYPIIYVRGYAISQTDVENTVADPYMGFNKGSTKLRQLWNRNVVRYYFESPLLRLMKDYQYDDVYEDGQEIPESVEIQPRSIFIYRYYDQASDQLGVGKRRDIEDYARGLGELILRVRHQVCGDDAAAGRAFKVYLVAHSMGGLICRCFIQNPKIDLVEKKKDIGEARKLVDKVFTYATPHNGIDLRVVGNVPEFISLNNANNFNRERMREYLGFPEKHTNKGEEDQDDESVANLCGKFDPDRFFCLVGTNHRDYGAAKWGVGPMSDGLVQINNATLRDERQENGKLIRKNAPRAFVYRGHSGHYGIVNSEEGYQNLTRFLFGDVRVDGVLEVKALHLPLDVEKKFQAGKKVRASYHFEVVLRTRGALWDLHRRTVSEGSAVFRQFDEMLKLAKAKLESPRHPHLFSAFLSTRQRINPRRKSLGFSLDLGVLVPQYEVDGILWFNHHYEGGHLYRDKINLEALPPDPKHPRWRLRYGFDSRTPNRATKTIEGILEENQLVFRVPVVKKTKPGIDAVLALYARVWNQ